ncbi:MAG: class I SAM-dependent methyltransferase [candidate division WOR-3 bacterium]
MEDVKRLYDEIYRRHKKNLPQIWHWPNEVENYYLKNLVRKIKPKLILDAGCGVGLKLENLRDYNPFGFDYSFEGVKICKDEGFKVVQGSIHQIPFKSNTFDLVISFQVIQYLSDLDLVKLAFIEVSRVLNKGGYFITVNYRLGGMLKERYMPVKENGRIVLSRWAFTVEDYTNLARESNLKVVKIGTILNIKPKGIGRFPFLKGFYKFVDFGMFKLGFNRGLYLFGIFQKV